MTFVMSAGSVRDVAPMTTTWATPAPVYVRLGPDAYSTYAQIWRTQPAVRTIVAFIARNIAQLGLYPYQRVSATDRVKLPEHPIARMLADPWPGSKWTKYGLINWTMQELGIYDNAYWIKGKTPSGTRGLLPMPNRYIAPAGDNPLMPEFYRLTGSRGVRDLAPDEVVHLRGYNPDDNRAGVSPIETLRQVLAEEWAAGRYRQQMWDNGARIGGYISRPDGAPEWSQTAKDKFMAQWQATYAGNGPATGGTPLLEEGMVFHAAGLSPKDAQYVESRKLTREEVAVAYHVPPVMAGLMEGAAQSSIAPMHRILYMDTFAPYTTAFAQDLQCQLLPDLDPAGAADGSVYLEFNLNEKLRGSFAEQAAALQAAVGAPWLTREEARGMFNLPHIDGADELIQPLNVIAGGLASPRDTAPDNPSNAESNGLPPGPKPSA